MLFCFVLSFFLVVVLCFLFFSQYVRYYFLILYLFGGVINTVLYGTITYRLKCDRDPSRTPQQKQNKTKKHDSLMLAFLFILLLSALACGMCLLFEKGVYPENMHEFFIWTIDAACFLLSSFVVLFFLLFFFSSFLFFFSFFKHFILCVLSKELNNQNKSSLSRHVLTTSKLKYVQYTYKLSACSFCQQTF